MLYLNHRKVKNESHDQQKWNREFKLKVKNIADEASQLARKVKEAQIAQKQKEREFVQARRVIERIRMAI